MGQVSRGTSKPVVSRHTGLDTRCAFHIQSYLPNSPVRRVFLLTCFPGEKRKTEAELCLSFFPKPNQKTKTNNNNKNKTKVTLDLSVKHHKNMPSRMLTGFSAEPLCCHYQGARVP